LIDLFIRLKTACKHGTNVGTHEIHARRNEKPQSQDGCQNESYESKNGSHLRQVRCPSGNDKDQPETKENQIKTDLEKRRP
jgi:hypothetical protein